MFFVDTINTIRVAFDRAKRDATFSDRGLAFEDAAIVFEGRTLDMVDDRFDWRRARRKRRTLGGAHGDRGLDPTGRCSPRDFDEEGK